VEFHFHERFMSSPPPHPPHHSLPCTVHEVRLQPNPGREPYVLLRIASLVAVGGVDGWYRVAHGVASALWQAHEAGTITGRSCTVDFDADGFVTGVRHA
jgi:hypothetical protein